MNIIFDINQVSIQNVYILEQKKNIIMDGQFTKVIYSNEWFTMNGIYLLFPVENFINETIAGKPGIRFSPYTQTNQLLIQHISLFETHILELYKKNIHSSKKLSNILSKQMYSGNMKITKEYFLENNSNSIMSAEYSESSIISPHDNRHFSGDVNQRRSQKSKTPLADLTSSWSMISKVHDGQYTGSKRSTNTIFCKNRDEPYDLTVNKYMIKISGIWENNEEIGLTYKLIEIGEKR